MLTRQFQTILREAGCDEAGRGCLAGPVVAAAVILPPDFDLSILDDSKKLSARHRENSAEIIKKEAIAWAIGIIDHEEIDHINILKASIKAMHQALDKLTIKPEFIIADGNIFYPYQSIPHKTIVEGDALFASIAAASILAKTHRDELMQELHLQYPVYGWNQNKGYATEIHRKAIIEHGICEYHRKTFAPVRNSIQLAMWE